MTSKNGRTRGAIPQANALSWLARHGALLPALAGVLLLLRAIDSRRPIDFVGAGALLDTAVQA